MTQELIARIEAASGPCIGLDADIEVATGKWSEHHYEAWQRYQECGEAVNPPMWVPVNPNRYTASIDAALTLVPEGHDKWAVSGRNAAVVQSNSKAVTHTNWTYAATPALALCAAALKARMV